MRGSLWTLVVVAVFSGLFLRGLSVAPPDNPTNTTSDVVTILDASITPVAGLLLLLVGVGAVAALAIGRSF
jgi:hypothetical protein